MKRLILLKLISFLLIFNTSLIAQDFKFGLVGGLDVTNCRFANKPQLEAGSIDFYPMISFNVNGYIGYKSAGFLGISAEPGFIRKGGIRFYWEYNIGDFVRSQMNYVQLPMFIDFHIGEKFLISIGPEFAYLINVKAKSKDFSTDISDYYDNDFELSGIVGFNYNIHKYFDVGLKYNHGLTYTKNHTWWEYPNTYHYVKEYNQYFQVFIRFKI